MFIPRERVKRLKKILDILVYSSAIIDILIFLVTTYALFSHSSLEPMVLPLNILLSIIVILTIVMGALLIFLRHYEKIFSEVSKTFQNFTKKKRKYHYKPRRRI